jgi:hypothetical protein
MFTRLVFPLTVVLLSLEPARAEPPKPLSLHPDNPHYLLFRGKPTILLTSGEHYGAVLNSEFDYGAYFKELKAHGFNLTRTFSGVYREVPGSFGIVENTLGPDAKQFICPWSKNDKGKFDLHAYNKAYFDRLKDFVQKAGENGIVVELVLFCAIYDDKLWDINPMNAKNNVNGAGKIGRQEIYRLKDQVLTELQVELVRELAKALKDFDNVYFEVCNEPYFAGTTPEWTDHIVEALTDTEKNFPARHLIAQNIANGAAKVEELNKNVSILNFHYATPPTTVAQNYHLKRPIADDETGFRGTDDLAYRSEAWEFLLAGGAIFSNLDYSISAGRPDGTLKVTTSPGGGGRELRKQLHILKEFMEGFDFVKMKPLNSVVKGGSVNAPLSGDPPQAKSTVSVLAEPGQAYALYILGGTKADLTLDLPVGAYKAEWVNTRTGKVGHEESFEHTGGEKALSSPKYVEDIALRIKRRER